MEFKFNFGDLLNLGGSVLQYKMLTDSAKKATKQNQAGMDRASAAISDAVGTYRADMEPWRKAGVNALGWLEKLNTPGAVDPAEVSAYVKGLPGYGFAEEELQRGIDARLAARGDRFSGRGMKDATRWKNEYLMQPAFSNWMGQLGKLAGFGPDASGQTGRATMQGAGAMGDLYGRMGSNASDRTGANALANQALSSNIMRIVNDAYTRGVV